MKVFDRYLFVHLAAATVFTAVTLAVVILLTQSLRFLELVINAGASGSAFWVLALLALPRFFEIILPIALTGATVFVYNRMAADSELTALRAAGVAPGMLARPALVLSMIVTVVLIAVTTWVAPVSLAGMQQMRQVIKAQVSSILFREGVFTSVQPGLTVFIRERAGGEMHGVLIHDGRNKDEPSSTITARRGVVAVTPRGQQILVHEGSRQSLNAKTGMPERLDFDRYAIEIPETGGVVRQRWREPDERTFLELFRPDPGNERDVESRREFMVEAHRRLITPFLAPVFTVLALAVMLPRPSGRRGQGRRIVFAVAGVVLIQGLYLAAFSLSRHSAWGLVLMYALVIVPLVAGLVALFPPAERRWKEAQA